MTFREWWVTYKLPVISSRGYFDVLQRATRAAYNAGKKTGREEEAKRWQTRQNSLSVSSGARRSTGG